MKEALAAIGVLALAVSLWLIRGYGDEKIIDSKNETIASLKNAAQSKDDAVSKCNALLDSKDATIKMLQDSLLAKGDLLAKNKALIDSENTTIKSLQEALQSSQTTIAKDNDLIASYQQQSNPPAPGEEIAVEDTGEKIYPEDNGFDAQNLGSGFDAYQVFGPVRNPTSVGIPAKIPNRTPWKFGKGNSGIAANGSGFYVTGATNMDSDGTTSQNGQAGYLQFDGSSISQSIKLPAGTYTVSFDYEGRRDYGKANQIAVSLDGIELFKGAPTNCNSFTRVTSKPLTLPKAGKYELLFRGLGAIGDVSGDHTTFIDNICIDVVKLQTPPPPTPSYPDIGIIEDDWGPHPQVPPTHL